MSVMVFLVILSILVIIHELGHFLAAKWQGVRVEEFGLGYPPRAKRIFTDKHGTEYTVNWLPFGGFVRLFGEEGAAADNKQAFVNKPAWRRMVIVLAGAGVNFVFGAILFGAVYSRVGIPTPLDLVRIDEVVPGSPAQAAGITGGIKVAAVWIEGEQQRIATTTEFIEAALSARGSEILLETEAGERIPVYVRTESETPEGEGAMGVLVADSELKQYPMLQMPFRGMVVGIKAAVSFGWMLLTALGQMLSDLVFMGVVPKDVAGPVGIAYVAQKDNLLSEGWLARFNFAAILSINLAIVNVLPLPALDGGRAVFVLWEMITKKRVKPLFERAVNTAGFALLIGLLILITVRDVQTVLVGSGIADWWGRVF